MKDGFLLAYRLEVSTVFQVFILGQIPENLAKPSEFNVLHDVGI